MFGVVDDIESLAPISADRLDKRLDRSVAFADSCYLLTSHLELGGYNGVPLAGNGRRVQIVS